MGVGIDLGLSRLFSRLQVRIILGFGLILLLSLVVANTYAGRMTRIQLEEFQSASTESQVNRAVEYFEETSNRRDIQEKVLQMSLLSGQRVVVRDTRGLVMADSNVEKIVRVMLKRKEITSNQVYDVREKLISNTRYGGVRGLNVILPDIPTTLRPSTSENISSPPPPPQLNTLLDNLRRSIFISGLVALVLGTGFALIISNWMLSPIRKLRLAVSKFGTGDFSERVIIGGTGEVAELGETFNIMASNIDKARKQRESLIADISHELRTPISNIQGYIEAISDKILEPDAENLKIIHNQIIQLSTIVEDLRVLAVADAGQLSLDRKQHDIADTLEECVKSFELKAGEKNIELKIEHQSDIRSFLFDNDRIKQVINNLLSNAIMYSPRGSRIILSSVEIHGTVQIAVKDNGVGIPSDEVEYIFDRFYRVDPSRNKNTGGRGLGLAITKELVEAHGGNISVESVRGEGTTFLFTIPSRVN
jgi:signal transduction histidine kinase